MMQGLNWPDLPQSLDSDYAVAARDVDHESSVLSAAACVSAGPLCTCTFFLQPATRMYL